MSNWRDQLSGETESKAVVTLLAEYYHYPVLLVLVGFAFWNRIRHWSNFVVDGEVFFRGNDPYYHLRSTRYVVENFPQTMPFDPWTNFPLGTTQSQFGTVYDQIIALAALVVGLGSPGEHLTAMVVLVAPPFFALLLCVPAYFIGRHLGGRSGGLVGVAFVALAPDRLLSVSVAGFTDHHIAEAAFMSLGVLGIMVALTVAEREKPVYELLVAREFEALRAPLAWSLLAGVAIAVYLWTWPPGVYLYGVLGVFFVVHLSVEHVRGRSPEHAAFVGVTALATAGLLQLSSVATIEVSATARSLLQPGMGLAVAAGIAFLAWLSRTVEARDLPRYAYPAAVAGSLAVGAGLMALALPGIFDFFLNQVDRVLGFFTAPGSTAGTVGEAQPMPPDRLWEFYSLSVVTAVLGAAVLLGKQVFDDEPSGAQLLVVVWAAFIVASSLTQLRFAYYLTVAVGALNAALVGFVMRFVRSASGEYSVESYQILTVAALVLVMFVPMVAVAPTPIQAADGAGQPGDVLGWSESLDWMDENTPENGQYARPDDEPMEPYGQYARTDDFEYPAGAYGVMSWWDYGHWITVDGGRAPVANPFQQGATEAATFLLAQNESAGQTALEARDDHADARTRYVMVDWKMVETETRVGGKFFAPPAFVDGVSRSDYYVQLLRTDQRGGSQLLTQIRKQPYYESMAVRLYLYHGSAQEVQPYVMEWQGEERELSNGQTFREAAPDEPPLRFFETVEEARAYANETESAQVGGIGPYPEERVPALERFRLVHMDEMNAFAPRPEARERGVRAALPAVANRDIRNTGLGEQLQAQLPEASQQERTNAGINFLYPNTPAWTKTFERVPGATIEGTGPANRTVTLTVTMEPRNGQTFAYTQRARTDADGEFTATVPYSTTGYDEWGVREGYTDPSVRAAGPYTIRTSPGVTQEGNLTVHTGEVHVTEGQVIGEDPSPATVTLEEEPVETNQEAESGEGGDQ